MVRSSRAKDCFTLPIFRLIRFLVISVDKGKRDVFRVRDSMFGEEEGL